MLPALRAAMVAAGSSLPAPDVPIVGDYLVGSVPVRFYSPQTPDGPPPPLLIFLHGGGFVFGDLDTHDAVCRNLAVAAGCGVVACAYRLAPEFPFPAGLDDCRAVFAWARDNAEMLGCDPARIAVGGESAGANLATAITLSLRDAGQDQPLFQLLVHPGCDFTFSLPSIDRVEAPGLNRHFLEACRDFYVRDRAEVGNPLVSPLLANNHAGLAPAIVLTVEVDPLRDDGEAYATALAAAGVETLVQRLQGLPHGFMFMPASLQPIDRAYRLIGRLVRRYFAEN
jgi:acetyl esterase